MVVIQIEANTFFVNIIADEEQSHSNDHGITLEWEKLTQFQRLVIIKILRPDVLTSSCNQFVRDRMGEKYLSTGSFDLKEIYEESTAKTPLIFILSPSKFATGQIVCPG